MVGHRRAGGTFRGGYCEAAEGNRAHHEPARRQGTHAAAGRGVVDDRGAGISGFSQARNRTLRAYRARSGHQGGVMAVKGRRSMSPIERLMLAVLSISLTMLCIFVYDSARAQSY